MRERDLVGREGRFIAEGKVVLNVLLSNPAFAVNSILILENRLAGLAEQLQACRPMNAGLLRIARDHGCDCRFPDAPRYPRRGQAQCATIQSACWSKHCQNEALAVVLCGISNHDNMGSIFRNAAAFEADCILMDETSCDPLYRKSIRVSVGAALKVPFARGRIDRRRSSTNCRPAGFEVFALSPSGTTSIYDAEPSPRTALLLGTEGEGLPKALLQKLQTVKIPMSRSFDSLNVATASGIALSRFSRFSGL